MNLMNKRMLYRFLKRFIAHTEAVALMEFALVFPIFFLLLFGGIEVNRLMLIQQKLEKSGYVLADIVTQYLPGDLKQSELNNNVFPQFTRTMNPYNDSTRQAIIITSIRKTGAVANSIMWQAAGGGSLSGCDAQPVPNCVRSIVNGLAPSGITPAVAGTPTAFPSEQNGFVNAIPVPGGKWVNLVVIEVFYFYQPYLQQLLQGVGAAGGGGAAGFNFYLRPKIFVKRTYFMPRQGNLFSLPPNFP